MVEVSNEVNENNEQSLQTQVESVDAAIRAYEDKNKLQLDFNIAPPAGQGADITVEAMMGFLEQRGIVYGIMQEEIERIAQEHLYDTNITVAKGQPAVDGLDGVAKELYPRKFKPTFKQRDDGTIDFKEMNIVINISQDDPICEITLPTPGEPGTNIYGQVLKPRPGRAAIVAQGENTCFNEEKTLLKAAISGSLVFRKERFCIDSVYTVEADVDGSTGNITFNGDVIVKGDVTEGFEIKCKGNVAIKGMVEGAKIVADGSITLEKGINGMNHGLLEAKGDVTSKYIENCTIRAGGNVLAESIINCQVESDGSVEVKGKHGMIVGGTCTAFGSVTATVVGSRAASQTSIVMGVTPSIMSEKRQISEQLKKMRQQIEEMDKNLAYLEGQQKKGKVTSPDHLKALSQLRIQAPIARMKADKLNKKLQQLEASILNAGRSMLSCKKIYPSTRISIGNAMMTVQDLSENVRFYRNDSGEIAMGKF